MWVLVLMVRLDVRAGLAIILLLCRALALLGYLKSRTIFRCAAWLADMNFARPFTLMLIMMCSSFAGSCAFPHSVMFGWPEGELELM